MTTRLVWAEEDKYIGTDSTGHSTVIAMPASDGTRVGMKASDLLLLALSACICADLTTILRKQRTPMSRLEVIAESTNAIRPPWEFETIHLTFKMAGKGLTEEAALKAVELAEGKYCSVSASLKPRVQITASAEILQADGQETK